MSKRRREMIIQASFFAVHEDLRAPERCRGLSRTLPALLTHARKAVLDESGRVRSYVDFAEHAIQPSQANRYRA